MPSIPLENSRPNHFSILILGGGSAGITVAAQLRRKDPRLSMAIVEPSTKHYYQPLWTLVGGGVFKKEQSEREEGDYIPKNTTWIRDRVHTFQPSSNRIVTEAGTLLTYDTLIIALGIQIDWNKIPGLQEGIGRNQICSNYSYQHVDYTWECVRQFRGGNAIFTMPNTAVKCGGAPQKIMYLAEETFRRNGIRDRCNVLFATAQGSMFAVEKYRRTLEKVIERKKIDVRFKENLIEIDPDKKLLIMEHLDTGVRTPYHFDLAHITPPMGPPDVIKNSELANSGGWVEVDKSTLQNPRYPNIFALGDCSGLPTSKTAAAIRKQAPVVVQNVIARREGLPLEAKYDGYTSCPIVTGYGKLVLAEFDYEGKPSETFPFDQSKERRTMYWLKAYALPILYWYGMLRGRA